MITCICVECEKSVKFKDIQESREFRWYILGIDIKENEFLAVCPKCDTTIVSSVTVSNKPKVESKPKLVNSKSISYD